MLGKGLVGSWVVKFARSIRQGLGLGRRERVRATSCREAKQQRLSSVETTRERWGGETALAGVELGRASCWRVARDCWNLHPTYRRDPPCRVDPRARVGLNSEVKLMPASFSASVEYGMARHYWVQLSS